MGSLRELIVNCRGFNVPADPPNIHQQLSIEDIEHLPSLWFVDLDGTLLKTDLLFESALAFARKAPWHVFLILFWCLRGRATLKAQLARRVILDLPHLPYDDAVLGVLRAGKQQGFQLVLSTASHQTFASQVARHLNLFDDIIATDQVNCKGEVKLRAIQARAGQAPYAYFGDSLADRPVFSDADIAVLVRPSRSRLRRVLRTRANLRVIGSAPRRLPALLRQLRPHQWCKNALLIIPMLAAHHFFQLSRYISVAVAIVAFSALSSSVYVINDLVDLDSDRRHLRKRFRPLASGALPVSHAFLLFPLLWLPTLACALYLPPAFGLTLIIYLVVNLAYSFSLKRVVVADTLVLAALYSLRLFAGAAATSVPLTRWMLAFSMFLFLSLAFLKRFSELIRSQTSPHERLPGRGYMVQDLSAVQITGLTCAGIAVLVLAMYVLSPDVARLYRRPDLLLMCCPVLFYWVIRMWMRAQRGEDTEDPIRTAMRDPASYLAGLCMAVAVWGAI